VVEDCIIYMSGRQLKMTFKTNLTTLSTLTCLATILRVFMKLKSHRSLGL